MKIKALVLASALLVCGTAFAQETNRDANGKIQYGSYETNKFFDNWFVGVAGGINAAHDNIMSDIVAGYGLAIDANVGKWIEPCFGIRAGWNGLKNGIPAPGHSYSVNDAFNYHYVHGDFLWNISNQFWGYKEKRVYNAIPYLTAGLMITSYGKDFAAGAGLLNKFRLGSVVDLTLDLRAVAAKGKMIGATAGAFADATALVGLSFNLGKSNWTRLATTVAGYTAAVAAAEAAKSAAEAAKAKADSDAAAAKAAADKLAKENSALKDELAAAANDNSKLLNTLMAEPVCVYFEIGKAKLSGKELAHFDYTVKTLIANNKNIKFTVAGNADTKTGTKKRNQQLSEQRAEYVYNLLTTKYGLSADQFTVQANGGNDIFDTPELNRAVIIEKQ